MTPRPSDEAAARDRVPRHHAGRVHGPGTDSTSTTPMGATTAIAGTARSPTFTDGLHHRAAHHRAAHRTQPVGRPSPPACVTGRRATSRPRDTGVITGDVVPEASGIAASSTDPDLFFVVDDDARAACSSPSAPTVRWPARSPSTACPPRTPRRWPTACAAPVTPRSASTSATSATTASRRAPPCRCTGCRSPTRPRCRRTSPRTGSTTPTPTVGTTRNRCSIADDASIVIVTRAQKDQPSRVYRGPAGGGDLTFVADFTPPKPHRTGPVTPGRQRGDRRQPARGPGHPARLRPGGGVPGAAARRRPAGFLQWPYRQVEIPEQWQSEGITYRGAAGLSACGFVVVSEKAVMTDPQIGVVDCA